jgi:hypothetical protein
MPEPTGTGAEEPPSSWKAVAAKHRRRAEKAESDSAALQERLDRQGYHGFSCQDEFQAWLDAGSPAQWEWTNPLQERLEEERLSPEEARAVLAVCEIIESREGEPIPWPPSMASALAKLTRLSQSVEGR